MSMRLAWRLARLACLVLFAFSTTYGLVITLLGGVQSWERSFVPVEAFLVVLSLTLLVLEIRRQLRWRRGPGS